MDRRLQTEERHGGKKGQLLKRSARGWSTSKEPGWVELWCGGSVCPVERTAARPEEVGFWEADHGISMVKGGPESFLEFSAGVGVGRMKLCTQRERERQRGVRFLKIEVNVT